MNLRTALHLFVLSTGILAAVRGPAQGTPGDQPLRFGRIASDGVSILNLSDEKGKEVARPAKGQLVAVYKDSEVGWLEVEVPGGYPVWVFGRYLKPVEGAEQGLYEVTGNAVNLRPAPSSDVTNFPLPQRLQSGDRVRGIELLEPEKPLAETWVRIWSPPGVRACLRSSAVDALAAGEDGPALWTTALRDLPAAPIPRANTAAGPKGMGAAERKEVEARSALEEARAAMERERQKETPDYDSVEAALNAVAAHGGTAALEARAELRSLAVLREAAVMKADLERERARRAEEALRQQREVWEKSREKDPLGAAFLVRGVVERRIGADGVARFYLRFGQQTTGELLCSSGRYDLSVFGGVEVGVHGTEVTSRTGELPTFEVARVEVIAVR